MGATAQDKRYVVGVDIGGTFTDAVAFDPVSGDVRVGKALTVPSREEDGALAAIEDMDLSLSDVSEIVHGHTVGLNAVHSRRGAKTAVLATPGYRDLLDCGRLDRPHSEMFNLNWQRPHQARPLVPRAQRHVVPGRIDADGVELTPIDTESVRRSVRQLWDSGVRSFAICLMNSYLNRAHEQLVADIVRDEAPEAYIQTSDVYPLAKESERTTTVVLDAYTGPLIIDYLGRIEGRLREAGFDGPVWIMGMSGGVTAIEQSKRFPITQLLSGPVGGVAHALGATTAFGKNLVTLDMGGTSTDVAVIQAAAASYADGWAVEWGLPIYLPMIEINTIGSGAGSIIAVDDVGSLSVGPRSAGSVPGPACYGRGGTEPALTDAFVTLGMIQPEFFFGGRLELDLDAAQETIARVAARAGIPSHSLADAAYRLSVSHIAEAIRSISTYRGLDIRDYGLVAGGAAGPLVAALVARELQVRETIVPLHPGQFSAFGLAVADVRVTEPAAAMRRLSSYSGEEFHETFVALELKAKQQIEAQGLSTANVRLTRSFKGMYVGQTWDNTYPAPTGPYDSSTMEQITETFHTLYRQRAGSSSAELPIMVTALEVTAEAPRGSGDQSAGSTTAVPAGADGNPEKVAPVWWEDEQHDTPFIQRNNLPVGQRFDGPLVVVEPHTTIAVPPGASVEAHENGHLTITWHEPKENA